MKLDLDPWTGGYAIRAYGSGSVTVNAERLTRSCIVMPDKLIRNWQPQHFDELTPEHFAAVAALDPEIVLIGSGAQPRFPAAHLLVPLTQKNIGVEAMDTAAACRVYGILLAEGRRVAAALLMIAA